MDLSTMNDGQRLPFTVSPKTKSGGAAKIEAGSLAVTFADEDASNGLGLTAEINPDGLSGFIHAPAGASGKSVATLSGDADLGAGVETISFSQEIEVVGRKATNLGVSFGTAEDEPATPPTAKKKP